MARVLLLESDTILASGVSQALQRRGHSVDWQVDPQTATNSSDHRKPDLIILDLLLAGRSGVEFLYELRSYPDWRELPVVIYSSVNPSEISPSLAGLSQLNILAYYHKPSTSLSQLTQSVDGILRNG